MSDYRGATFSPASAWYAGSLQDQSEYALEKLDEVSRLLVKLANELHRNSQRHYDLIDAARTISDARAKIREERRARELIDER